MSTKRKKYFLAFDDENLEDAPESVRKYLCEKGAPQPTDDDSPPFGPPRVDEDSFRGHTARRGAQPLEQIKTQVKRYLKDQGDQEIRTFLKDLGLLDGLPSEGPSKRSEVDAISRLRAENDQREAEIAELRAEEDRARKLEAEIQRLKRQKTHIQDRWTKRAAASRGAGEPRPGGRAASETWKTSRRNCGA
ncbi:hypothetical protein GGTG_14415 [Gaeumannomyces tritici R3-111a-1]|uniref:Uncharacterized protein n=1 Tax=Gaeumannomyces tritici (strain R3-111a-1) TaxID=644352 RepID=J3PLE7_GAET3|nr:hypothetical protein GGTG_14415 [Gaeumannomyces tritici R3-111a-1]EJT68008.1 hypothetical protein GGTG_14415 [Gaeumannomyces tritici R3-111a-1]